MTSLLKIPGMVDPHVHLRGMDWSHKGTFATETEAAIAGGYWAVLDMPNTAPSTISASALARKLEIVSAEALCDWGVYFGASQDDNSSEYGSTLAAVCGLKIYNNATTGTLLIEDQRIRQRHFQAWPANKVIAVHAEGKTVLDILALVRETGKRTHFCHISTAEEIGYLQAAKEEGLPVSIGVTPHHLYLTQNDLNTLGPLGLMKPELKTPQDVDALWAAVSAGVVDVIESDHAPHTLQEKHSGKPTFGVPGLETNLPLTVLALQQGRISETQLIGLLATNAQRIFGLKPDEDTYTLVDTSATFTIDNKHLHTKCGWSPFDGMRVQGKVTEVWIRGQQVFDGEQILCAPGFGQNLFL